MIEIPISLRCKEILDKREHALIGISPFNSYYSEENIKALIYWGHNNFKNFHLLVPDTLPYFNFLAVGYTSDQAMTKTKKQVKYLLNKINRAFSQLMLDNHDNCRVYTISKVAQNLDYIRLYDLAVEKYNNDSGFKKMCHEASGIVLKTYTDKVTDDALDSGSKYLLGELPFYFDTPSIVGNLNTSIFVYHEEINFFVNLYKERNNAVSYNQGHLVLHI